MSLLKWVKSSKITEPSSPGLPSPSRASTEKEAIAITAANNAIESLADSPKSSPSRPCKRKRGEYGSYTPEQRAKYAKLAEEVGVTKASRKISQEFGKQVSETTNRSMRNDYRKKVKTNLVQRSFAEIKTLPTKVNTTIVVAAAQGIVGAENRALLKENCGHMDINRDYARSLMRRMNLVKRKGKKTARKLKCPMILKK